jgi:hypothetical protein
MEVDMVEKVEKIDVNELPPTARPTGLEDVTRAVRGLLRTSRDLGESTFDVAERELAMAIQVSAQIRDSTLSEKALERARTEGVTARLRQDAHQAVDIAADLGSILYTSGLDFLERFADDRRPPLSSDKG